MIPLRHLDLSLYLVTDTRLCGGTQGVVDTVLAAVTGGVTAVQLRDTHANARALVALARRLRETLSETGVPLIVNDRADVAAAAGADGVHVGQEDLPVEVARALLGPDAFVGLSIQRPDQLAAVRELAAGAVDYLGAGPVLPQRTKGDAAAPMGLDTLAEVVRGASLPVVAIGGIDTDNAAAVRATGVDGIAVVSAICGRPDPAAAARALRNCLAVKEVR
ncbi:thiamine phosphate synthase [Actinopolymorpha sp. B11F2]|uniref:thiamine phosphate synthase n=1 Tax=Actinopolymorpha sp. B11F2 TaxID=3160862 RepID=UPI0032E46225